MNYNQIGDDGAKYLSEGCSSFQVLDLGHNQIGDDGAKHLGEVLQQCKKLRNIDLNYNQTMVRKILPKAVSTYIYYHIGDYGARYIAEGLENCELILRLYE